MGFGMNCQPQVGETRVHCMLPRPQSCFVCSEKQEVVHITDVALAAQGAFDEVVERVEIHVGPELARQIADREATWTVYGKEVIATVLFPLGLPW